MLKNIIVAILVILIIASLGTIGYLIYVQKGGNLKTLTDIVSKVEIPKPNISFPLSSSTNNTVENQELSLPESTSTQPEMSSSQPLILDKLSLASIATLNNKKELISVFIDKSSGHIYSLDSQNNTNRLTNATFVETNEAYFGNNGNSWGVIIRQNKDGQITNTAGQFSLATSSNLGELKTFPWPINLISLAISSDKQKLAYLAGQNTGGSAIYVSDWGLKKPQLVWTGPLKDWLISWPNSNLITIASKPASNYSGSLYFLDLKTKKTTRILNKVNGLTTNTSPDGQKLIYSKSLLNSSGLYLYNISDKTSRLLELNTLAEKCVWATADILYCAIPRKIPQGNYPEDWYLGKVNLTDDLWQIDLKQKTTVLVNKLKGDRDLINLTLNLNTGWLYAKDKKDNTLQAFPIKP